MPPSIFAPEYSRLIKLLIDLRTEKRVTQAELARRLGQPQSYVSKYEHSQRRLDIGELIVIARALEADAWKLVAQIESEGHQ